MTESINSVITSAIPRSEQSEKQRGTPGRCRAVW
jgi:hypothetical protein